MISLYLVGVTTAKQLICDIGHYASFKFALVLLLGLHKIIFFFEGFCDFYSDSSIYVHAF